LISRLLQGLINLDTQPPQGPIDRVRTRVRLPYGQSRHDQSVPAEVANIISNQPKIFKKQDFFLLPYP
jgi:hypothetical protein